MASEEARAEEAPRDRVDEQPSTRRLGSSAAADSLAPAHAEEAVEAVADAHEAVDEAPKAIDEAREATDEAHEATDEAHDEAIEEAASAGDVHQADLAVASATDEASDEAVRADMRPNDEHPADELSLSSQFFRSDEDSVPPVEPEEPERPPPVVLSPQMIARRARFRRAVAGVVAFVGALSIAGIGRRLLASPRAHVAEAKPKPALVAAAKVAVAPAVASDRPQQVIAQPPAATASPTPSSTAEVQANAAPPAATETPSAAAQVPAEAATAPAPAEPLDEEAIKALKKEVERLYTAGKNQEAIDKANELIAADPTDALPYLFLGSALQTTGKWKDGKEAYSECVRHATKGPVSECFAMGGHK